MQINLAKRLNTLVKHEWCLFNDIDWKQGIDLSKPFLPLSSNFVKECELNHAEALAVSQILGVMAMSAIAEHEKVLDGFKEPYWRNEVNKLADNRAMLELGEQFFKEEQKHASAFNRYVDEFANSTNVSREEMNNFIPQYSDKSIFTKLFKLNAKLGGQAVWWAIATTEAESISVYDSMRKSNQDLDSLYTQIHKLHFEEELRHKCYAFLVLDIDQKLTGLTGILRKFDFAFSHLVEMAWASRQVIRLKNIERVATRHKVYENFNRAMKKFNSLSFYRRMKLIIKGTPYLSPLFVLNRHNEISEFARTKDAYFVRTTESKKQAKLLA